MADTATNNANNQEHCAKIVEEAKEGKSIGARALSWISDAILGPTGRTVVDAATAAPQMGKVLEMKDCAEHQEKNRQEGIVKEEKVGKAEGTPANAQPTATAAPTEKSFLSGIFDKMDGAVKLPSSQDKDGGIISGMLKPNAAASGELLPKPAPTPAGDPALAAGAAAGR